MDKKKTLQKCRKIMTLFETKKSNSINLSKNVSKDKNKLSSHKLPKRQQKSGLKSYKSVLNNSTASLKSQKYCPSPHKSVSRDLTKHQNIYNRQSRYEKIMKLNAQVKSTKKIDPRSSYLQSSRSSITSLSSGGNKSVKKESRLEKIMKLKVSKPQTQSTLKHYEPVKRQKSQVNKENTDYNSVLEMKRCKDIIKKEHKQGNKEDRLWKVFERERELRLKQKMSRDKSSYEKEASLEKRFDSLVQKELKKIQHQKQIEERKDLGFSPYLFPSY